MDTAMASNAPVFSKGACDAHPSSQHRHDVPDRAASREWCGRYLAAGADGLPLLLIETNDGLALVDTGLGLDDIAEPHRLGRRWVRQTAPRLDPAETAFQQVKALGFSPNDVRHLLLTHLDRDHAGGVPDFHKAKVHVHRREYAMAVTHQIPPPAGRYVTDQWKHGPDWKFYGEGGEHWFGFEGARA
jgi:glyoxylase-like metal-dependent hydrolase (beta-lactamase superfamily II)